MTDEEFLAREIDAHCLALLRGDGKQATAIAWMKKAFNLLEKCSKDLRKPRIYQVPGTYGCPTYMLTPPKSLELPPANQLVMRPPVWFSGGTTVQYGDKYQNRHVAWTAKDTRRLVREQERQKLIQKQRDGRKGSGRKD